MPAELAAALREGERRALGRAISLVESTRPDHRAEAEALLTELLPYTGGAHRVALTGPPGAGKSTLVDVLGMAALEAGHAVAVLAVDPASPNTRGSILGDALRMERLSGSGRSFIRASSNSGVLGGIAPATREAIWLCEAAGYDLVLVETVGVGQAEFAARDACDTLLLLTLAFAGDDVQAIKRGVLEVADAVLVNKADGAHLEAVRAHADELTLALGLLRAQAPPHVSAVSARSLLGVPELLSWLSARARAGRESGEFSSVREQQLRRAFRSALEAALLEEVRESGNPRHALERLEADVAAGRSLPSVAARLLARQVTSSASASARP